MAQAFEHLARGAPALASVDEAQAGVLVAEEDVLGHAEPVDQVEFLVDGGEAEFDGVDGAPGTYFAPVEQNGALVRLVHSGEHFDQGGFSGAVLAEQAVHLARAYVQIDPVQRAHAGELLDDALHDQHRKSLSGVDDAVDVVG